MKRGHYGNGTIDPSGEDCWRLRYYLAGRRYSKHVKGAKADAARELRNLLKAADDGSHVAPNRLPFKIWVESWLALKARSLEAQSLERYAVALRVHAVPVLGQMALQKISAVDIDKLFGDLARTLAPQTLASVFMTLKSCLSTAVKKGLLSANPCDKAEQPVADSTDAATVLEEGELTTLVQGFRDTSIYPIVCVGAFTGMRRNEILALRWIDVNLKGKTVSVTRSQERTKEHGRRVKGPKTTRGRRTIQIDDGLATLLKTEKDKHLRLVAGVPEGIDVDLSLIQLPNDALCFPAIRGAGLTALQSAESVTGIFKKHAAKLGWPGLRFHDLRASHGTHLLDRGVGVHVVADRLGHDAAMLLRVYAKRTRKSDDNAANVISTITRGVL